MIDHWATVVYGLVVIVGHVVSLMVIVAMESTAWLIVSVVRELCGADWRADLPIRC